MLSITLLTSFGEFNEDKFPVLTEILIECQASSFPSVTQKQINVHNGPSVGKLQ